MPNDDFSMIWSKLVNLFIAFFVVFVPLMAFVLLITNSEYFERNYLSMDLALVTEAALSSPNNLIYVHDRDLMGFSFKAEEKNIEIYKKEGENNIIGSAKSYYLNNPSLTIEYNELDPIIETIGEKKTVIPIELVILKRSKVEFLNAKEVLLNNE